MKKKTSKFIFFGLFFLGILVTFGAQEEKPIKIAIASEGEALDTKVGYQAARSQWFLFFDEKGNLTETLENPYRKERGKAGIKSGNLLADKEVTHFVAGCVGAKMAKVLKKNHIHFTAYSGTVEEAITHVLDQEQK